MANPFSRTMRSLNADNYRISFIGMGVALLLLSVWTLWFFTARVTIYKNSKRAYIVKEESIVAKFTGNTRRAKGTRQYSVIAEFSREDMDDIRPGQQAMLYIDPDFQRKFGNKSLVGAVPAMIKQTERSKARAKLFALMDAELPIRLQSGMTAKVVVEVRHMTPAAMVMQASGMVKGSEN